MSGRFKLNFNNNGSYTQTQYFNQLNSKPPLASAPRIPVINKNQGLNAPMVGRVYKARPGCSACGKKVA